MVILSFILNIVLFLVSLGVLITIHELGHFWTAKLFNVYCIDFSIGFGPKFFKRKRKGGETTFSIGAIPLGGYVLMYGEGTELPDGVVIDQARSLEGIKKWKRAVILSAGIVLNMILGMALFLISNTVLPYSFFEGEAVIAESSIAHEAGVRTGDYLDYAIFELPDTQEKMLIVDSEVDFKGRTYVLGFLPNKVRNNPKLVDGIYLFEPYSAEELLSVNYKLNEADSFTVANIPNLKKSYLSSDYVIGDTFTASVYTLRSDEEGGLPQSATHDFVFEVYSPGLNEPLAWKDLGIAFTFVQKWNTLGEGLKATWDDFAYANSAVVRGIGMLFTGQGEVSGFVGIFSTSSTILADYGFGSYLFLWGLISVNLAIFNLLPFPGLDGWQLLVTAIEGITRKKVPTKVKAIISAIGLVLLFGLMIFITIKDIMGLF
ncbi:MAG: site-2 protease family protein [Bacilli bacterium]|jgi:regulator of sigma E protease